jgi:hypothetical protein
MCCSKCGKPVADDTKFCSSCGEKVEVHSGVENMIPTPTEKVVTKKTPEKKKIIFIAIAVIVLVGLVITYFIINPPISGSEVPYDLKWGSTNEQVQMLDKHATGLRTEPLIGQEQFATSLSLSYKDFGIKGNMGVSLYYYFGQDDSLDKIEISVPTGIDFTGQDYKTIKGKIEKYYNAVCKVSATKSNPISGDDEILTWRTANNAIRIGDDNGNKNNVVITIIPNTASNSSQPTSSDAGSTVSYDAFTFNESVFEAENSLKEWFEDIGKEWDGTSISNVFDAIQAAEKDYPDVYAKVQSQHNSIESTYNNSLSKLPNDSYTNIYNAVVKLHEDYIALYSEINCTSLTLMDSSNLSEDTWSVNVSDLTTAVGEDYEALNALKYSKN